MEKNLQKLEKLLSLMESDGLTEEKFLSSFKKVMDYVKKIEQKNIEQLDRMDKALKILSDKVKSETGENFKAHKSEMDKMVNSAYSKMYKEHEDLINKVNAKLDEVRDGIDGKDADEEAIIEAVKSQIEIPEIDDLAESLPQLGTNIRDSLELLQGDERLDASAIKGLEEFMSKKTVIGGMIPSQSSAILPRVEQVTGTVNGSNKAFTVANVPQFVTVQGQVMYDGSGYTLSSSSGVLTITFDNAPVSGDFIRSHY